MLWYSIIEYESDASESRKVFRQLSGEKAYNVTVVTEDDELSSAFVHVCIWKVGAACKHILSRL